MTPAPEPPPVAEAAAARRRDDRVFHALAMRLVTVAPGRACLEMAVRADMLNSQDICHGGLVFTLADTAFAYVANAHYRTRVRTH
ncbi:MAG: hotdog fold thioesterase [Alphaproteobacteria bacterium]|jgi:acyl-CoA thioesterase|nr:hotdog fold thioesterase [Alphaproteobacteria bacterium]MDP6517336.1 hotdog fold thioesterase [Alphaproteobacteria bacterium]